MDIFALELPVVSISDADADFLGEMHVIEKMCYEDYRKGSYNPLDNESSRFLTIDNLMILKTQALNTN